MEEHSKKPLFRWRSRLVVRNELEAFLEKLFLEHGPQGIVKSLSFLFGAFVITNKGVIIGADDSILEMLGYDQESARGLMATDLVADYDRGRLNEIFASNNTVPYLLDLLAKDGSIRHTRVSPKLFHVQNELFRLAEFVDITDVRIAESQAKEREEKFKAIFSHGTVGIARIAIGGKCLEVNKKLCEILGYTEDELMLLSFRDITHPEDLDINTAMAKEMVEKKRDSYSLEKRYIRKDGEVIWCHLSASLIKDVDQKPLYIVVFIEDINDRIELTERLQLSDLIVSASSDLLAIVDEHGTYLATNESYANAFGLPREYFPGTLVKDVFSEEIVNDTLMPLIDKAKQGELVNYSKWFDLADKGKRFLNISYSPLFDDQSSFRGIAISARDITDLKVAEIEMRQLNEKLERYSFIDGLTQITNRRMLDDSVSKEWNRSLRAKTSLAFVMIDLDYFKKYNDHYGHPQGDECLKKIATILNNIANRSSDIVARYGGEEFAILAPYSNIEQATQLAEICRKAIEEEKIPHAYTEDANLKFVTISIGVSSVVPSKNNSIAQLIETADRMLYKAKANGRNRVCSS